MERKQDKNPFAPPFQDLPETLPVFPLTGVLLLPSGNLPLNIFEPRYLQMVEDALASSRMIGMIQPKEQAEKKPELYDVGCAGKIIEFTETQDGRYLISLSGICRFKVKKELSATTMYRQVQTDWAAYKEDLEKRDCLKLEREKLYDLLKTYFARHEMACDWGAIKDTPDNKLITCLSMVCPFGAKEKQALLEAPCCKTRSEIFMTMLEMATHGNGEEMPAKAH